jgi:Ala-tRNA(Pro) deacylase
MPATRDDLMAYLAGLGIETATVDHPPLHTVEESRALRGEIAGAHTKNLFVKDKKDAVFLITAPEDAALDLKQVHHAIGASGRVSFGKPELMMALLGVLPGSVTPFGMLNDTGGRVTMILDKRLMEAEAINCHPLVNTATTTISPAGLLAFLRATGHEPKVVALAG